MTQTHTHFQNPILPGFYPDPSICRVGDDYYLVTSTFEWFPGVPVFHSRDLVHWRQIGHVLTRPSQLNLDRVPPSHGIFAATIRYHKGVFYVITTWANHERKLHNFIVTTTDPAGEWSDPYFLEDAPGIDPSLYFEGGHAYYTGNRTPTGQDHRATPRREIWLQELDLTTMQLIGEKYVLWDGMTRGEAVPEAPHIYKVGDYYYLVIAEGGTYLDHCVTIARSTNLTGPYEGYTGNPILTHRHLGATYPIINVGHADLVETQNGEWWMVVLGSRPVEGYFYNLGRETWLLPVAWQDDWLIASPGTGRVEFSYPRPNLPVHRWESAPACDHFDTDTLPLHYHFLRTPREPFWSLTERLGHLRLRLRPEALTEYANPSYIARRQQHINFAVRAKMEFTPTTSAECAGLAIVQNHNHHIRCVCIYPTDGNTIVRLVSRANGEETLVAEDRLHDFAGTLYWKIEGYGMRYRVFIALQAEGWQCLGEIDGSFLSTTVAEGFTGVYIGMYASSEGTPSTNHADFDYFEYVGLS